ncbi:hypothetical protein ACFLVC_04900 [Chloroflexota bacterium]
MKRCPNCARETVRTSDWVCQWCGFPLVSGSYKKIDKTFRELKEERMPQPRVLEEEEPEVTQEPEAELEEEIGVEPVSEPAPELEVELSPEEVESEPEPEPASKPRPRARRTPAAGRKSTSKSKTTTETKPVKSATRRKTSARSKSAPETETESAPAAETETELAPVAEIETETALPPAGIEITVAELLSAYETDMEAADARFSNQIMRITGVIDRVEIKDTFNIYFINLISSEASRLLQGVRCVFDSKDGPELSQLVNGQTVTVQGKYDGSMIDISLKDCRLVG